VELGPPPAPPPPEPPDRPFLDGTGPDPLPPPPPPADVILEKIEALPRPPLLPGPAP